MGNEIEALYASAVTPAVESAGMMPVSVDSGRTAHRRLLVADYAIVDCRQAPAELLYYVGLRASVRPSSTLALHEEGWAFDAPTGLCALPLTSGLDDAAVQRLRDDITAALRVLMTQSGSAEDGDRALAELLGPNRPCRIARLKTDAFRNAVSWTDSITERLISIRELAQAKAQDELARLVESLPSLETVDPATLIDILLTQRRVDAWQQMIHLYDRLPPDLRRSPLLREQHAFALNRLGLRDQARLALEHLIDEQGPTSEVCGILGRIYKDLWHYHRDCDATVASRYLDRAIEVYMAGFNADWRDAYPGVNAATLRELRGGEDLQELREQFVPVVAYAVQRRIEACKPDYWDHSTLLELAAIGRRYDAAERHLGECIGTLEEPWQAVTTVRNLQLIAEHRTARDEDCVELVRILESLSAAAEQRGATTTISED